MNLRMSISNIKSIKDLSVDFPLEKGLYAITGENATGKSTISMCASAVFYHFEAKQFFGILTDKSSIKFETGDQCKICQYDSQGNMRITGHINIKGFFEGSLIYGNRFRNTYFQAVKKLDAIADKDLVPVDVFIRENLGLVLCNDKSYYKNLHRLKRHLQDKYRLGGIPFFYTRDGVRVHQAHMSTGENLMLSIIMVPGN